MLLKPTTASSPTAMTLADFTSPSLIVPHLRGQDAASVIQELSQSLQREKRVPDLLPFFHAALNREYLVSSDLEAGVAFPHARLPGLKDLTFAFGRSNEPLDWGAKARRSIKLVFLIAAPATDSTMYMLLIRGLARLSKDNRPMERLHAAHDANQMFEVLQQITLQTGQAKGLSKKMLNNEAADGQHFLTGFTDMRFVIPYDQKLRGGS